MKSPSVMKSLRYEVWNTRTEQVRKAFSRLAWAASDCARRNALTPDTYAVRDREPERFGGLKGRRKGGSRRGARKARASEVARAAVQVRYARERERAEAYAELLEVAREVGHFLDSLTLVDNSLRERGRELSDRLYSAVSKVRGGTKD